MKIGIELDWQRRHYDVNRERLQLVDRLGYDMVFTAEGLGSDALTPLGYVIAVTDRIGVGTRVLSNSARTPAAVGMAFTTLRHMGGADREYICGLGNTMPAVVEGWHGVEWTSPYWRMRDQVRIIKKVISGEPVEHDGRVHSVPYKRAEGMPPCPAGFYEPPLTLELEAHPESIKVFVGAGTELMTRTAAEVGDGFMPNGSWAPGMMDFYRPILQAGLAKRPAPLKLADFPLWAHVDVLVNDDVRAAMREFKVYVAQWVGGYGGAGGLYELMTWRGYKDAADRILELYAAGRRTEAEDAVPDEYIDAYWLVGPLPRVVERFKNYWINEDCNLIIRTDNWPGAKPADNAVYEPLMRALRG